MDPLNLGSLDSGLIPGPPILGVQGLGAKGTAANLAYDYARLATIPVVPVSYVAVWLLSIMAYGRCRYCESGYEAMRLLAIGLLVYGCW